MHGSVVPPGTLVLETVLRPDAATDDLVDLDLDALDEEFERRRRRRWHVVASALTTIIGAGIAMAMLTGAQADPQRSPAAASAAAASRAVQSYTVPDSATLRRPKRDRFVVSFDAPPAAATSDAGVATVSMPSAPVAPVGVAQAYAAQLIAEHGWGTKQFACLVPMWARESGWNAHAGRPNGPYGIPQAYPGSKMASAGAGWLNDYRVQIRWGLGYIIGRYGTPCGAWAHWQSSGSY